MRELARYEKLEHLFKNDADSLRRCLFGPERVATGHVAESGGEIVGYSISFRSYSTFLGKPGVWLEDLFVLPSFRGKGVGKALLRTVAAKGAAAGCSRVEWAVLDWNQSAIDFYKSLGADVMPDWRMCRLTGEGLESFASG
jgi:GNAT superfamily N-acetyltransferase